MLRLRSTHPLWNRTCSFCGARLLMGEPASLCCNNGKWKVPPLPQLPPRISQIVQDASQTNNLSAQSRCLNNLFCFTAIGASKGFTHFDTGPPSVSITGRTYHRMFDISDNSHSLHWFLYDERERQNTANRFNVPCAWTNAVKAELYRCNPYVQHLRQFNSLPDSATTGLELGEFSSGGDFAAIMHAANSTAIEPRNIVIWRNRDAQPTFVPILSRHYEPLQYPLLFPHGSPGWGLTNGINTLGLTQRQWYKSRILSDDRFLTFGRLSCEYFCDMYSRIEEQHLNFIRRSLPKAADDINEHDAIQNIELPASFMGSRKWASEQTADSLALARVYGPPSLFITMTCNPDWPEIKARLQPGQHSCDAPTIVVRAFKLRVQRLLTILRSKFGKMIYMIKVIEFQKRGLPHCHIVVKVYVYTFLEIIILFSNK